MQRAGHTDTPSGLTAAWNRGKALAEAGAGESLMYAAMERCRSKNMAEQLKAGFEAALEERYKL